MPIEPIRRSAISEDIIRHIMDLIRNHELRPGDKLPSERQLAEEFQVSRVSLREGMRTLAFMNILDVRTGDGTYVTSLSAESLMEPLEFVLEVDDSTIIQLLQARQMVEPQLAAQAAHLITENELEELDACLQQLQDEKTDYSQLSKMDVDFHLLIAQAARNPFMFRFMSSLRSLGERSRNRTIQIDTVRRQSQQDHEAIVQALHARDAQSARAAMAWHLEHIEQGLRNSLDEETT
jgi:GntR family transcriptional regulator, transcriptional repressor for pyruvate dehydrogenase complex